MGLSNARPGFDFLKGVRVNRLPGFLGWIVTGFLAVSMLTAAKPLLGASQSPIDIRPDRTVYNPALPPLLFNYSSNTSLDLKNTGSPDVEATIKVSVPAGAGSVTVDGIQYDLLQFHFHSEAEHLIDGVRGEMELHLVHQSAGGALLVVGQIINLGAFNADLDPIFANLPQTPGTHQLLSNYNLANLLPPSLTTFRYDGSLTTAPYTEGVKWNVLTTPTTLSQGQIDAFRALFPDGDSREEQDLDGRLIQTDLPGFATPEPSTWVLALLGAVPALVISRRRHSTAA